jgi:cholinesterase
MLLCCNIGILIAIKSIILRTLYLVAEDGSLSRPRPPLNWRTKFSRGSSQANYLETMNNKLLASTFLSFTFYFSLPANAVNLYTQIYTFGDSLVDGGNAFNTFNPSLFPPAGLPPSPPYAQKFSNGNVWVENLAAKLNLNPVNASEISPSNLPTDGVNFAFGGATTGNTNLFQAVFGNNPPPPGFPLPGLTGSTPETGEIAKFAQILPSLTINDDALFVISIGSNDYFQALSNPATLDPNLPNAVTDNIVLGIQSLYNLGARNFLISSLPNLGTLPSANNSGVAPLLNNLSTTHNFLLDQKLTGLGSLADIKISTLELDSLLQDIQSNPQNFGLTDVTNSCLTNFRSFFTFDGICNNPDEFLFWDDVHPTSRVHEIIGEVAFQTIHQNDRPVAEPNTKAGIALLAILGLGKLTKKLLWRGEKTNI